MKEVVSAHKSHELYTSNPPLPDSAAWTEVINKMKLVQVNLTQHLTEHKFKEKPKLKSKPHKTALIHLEQDLLFEKHLVIPSYKELKMKKKSLAFTVAPQENTNTFHKGYDPLYQSTISLGNPSFLSIEAHSLVREESSVTILGDRNFEVTLPLAISNSKLTIHSGTKL